MKTALIQVVEALARILNEHDEVGDTAVREAMYEAVKNAFIMPISGYELPHDFEMFTQEGNEKVRAALARFLAHPEVIAASRVLKTPRERLDAFQEPVETSQGYTQDEFFGFADSP